MGERGWTHRPSGVAQRRARLPNKEEAPTTWVEAHTISNLYSTGGSFIKDFRNLGIHKKDERGEQYDFSSLGIPVMITAAAGLHFSGRTGTFKAVNKTRGAANLVITVDADGGDASIERTFMRKEVCLLRVGDLTKKENNLDAASVAMLKQALRLTDEQRDDADKQEDQRQYQRREAQRLQRRPSTAGNDGGVGGKGRSLELGSTASTGGATRSPAKKKVGIDAGLSGGRARQVDRRDQPDRGAGGGAAAPAPTPAPGDSGTAATAAATDGAGGGAGRRGGERAVVAAGRGSDGGSGRGRSLDFGGTTACGDTPRSPAKKKGSVDADRQSGGGRRAVDRRDQPVGSTGNGDRSGGGGALLLAAAAGSTGSSGGGGVFRFTAAAATATTPGTASKKKKNRRKDKAYRAAQASHTRRAGAAKSQQAGKNK